LTFKRLALPPAALLVLSLGAFAAPVADAHSWHGARAARRSHTVRFYARVVTASRDGVLVRTLSGRSMRFSAVQIARERAPLASHRSPRVRASDRQSGMHFAYMAGDVPPRTGPVAINVVGLQPGVTVLIAKTVNRGGRMTVRITLPPSNVTAQQTDSGVVTDTEDGSFQIRDGGGAALRFTINPGELSNLNLRDCSTVDVVYRQYGSVLIADEVRPTGASSFADCTPATGASEVQHAERYASGRVTAVSSRRVTILDGDTGRSETFVTDPRQGLQLCTYAFDGVHVGDQIDVTYHRSRAAMVADSVSDPGAGS
jgi:hypothetical protein